MLQGGANSDFMLDFVRNTAQFGGRAAHREASCLDGQKFDGRAILECGLVRALRKGLRMKKYGGDGQYGECGDGVFHGRYERKRLIVVGKTGQM